MANISLVPAIFETLALEKYEKPHRGPCAARTFLPIILTNFLFCQGKYYAVNIPLRDGMDDESYESIFVPIISKVMETFQPSAVVLQCGADSLTGKQLLDSSRRINYATKRISNDFVVFLVRRQIRML